LISELRPYASYNDSEHSWLGALPDHWSKKRAKYFFTEVDERSMTGEEELLSVSHLTGVTPRRHKNVTMFLAESNVGHKRCRPGDVVINTMWAWMAALGVARETGVVSPSYGVYRPIAANGLSSDYVDRLLRTPTYAAEYVRRSTGINSSRLRLYPDRFLAMPIICPPMHEQLAIVDFLAYVDRRIDRCILAKLKLIRLLEEHVRTIIGRTVTQGLEPNVSLKASSIEWLGKVPKHWEVVALRLRYSVQLGKMLDAKNIRGDYLVPYLRNTDTQWGRVNSDNLPTMDIRPDEYGRYTVRGGDLLVCEGGEVGRAAIWDGPDNTVGYQKALHRLRPLRASRDDPRFLYFVLLYAAKQGVFQADGSENTIAHLTAEKLRRYRLAFPPIAEQGAIAVCLDEMVKAVERLVELEKLEISLLREYRTRISSDVVTGKLDVRKAAANVPDEAEEPDEIPLADDIMDGGEYEDVSAVEDVPNEEVLG
jgi:type I restriction enzyme S subunit